MKGSYSKQMMCMIKFNYISFEECYSAQNIVGRVKEPEHAMDAWPDANLHANYTPSLRER